MRKLICAKDVEVVSKEGGKSIPVDSNTIITPSAKDAAKAAGIEFTESNCPSGIDSSALFTNNKGEIDSNMIYTVLKAMVDKGMLKGLFDSSFEKPFVEERDPAGLKIVRGNTVKYEKLDTGNPADKVFYQEILNSEDGSSMNAGFITIEDSLFDWECSCQEIYHILEGKLTVSIDDREYTGGLGDTIFFPKGAKVRFGARSRMKAFYATY